MSEGRKLRRESRVQTLAQTHIAICAVIILGATCTGVCASVQLPTDEGIIVPIVRCIDAEAHTPSNFAQEPQLLFVITGGMCVHPTTTIIRRNVLKIWELHADAHILITIGIDTQDLQKYSEGTCTRKDVAHCASLMDLQTVLSADEEHGDHWRSGGTKGLDVLFFEKSSCGAFEVGGIVAAMWSGHRTAHTYIFMQSHMWIEQSIPEEYFWRRDFNEVDSRGGWGWKSGRGWGWKSEGAIAEVDVNTDEDADPIPYKNVIYHWRQERQRRRRGAACGFVPLWHFNAGTFVANLDFEYALHFLIGVKEAEATGFSEADVRPFLSDLVTRTGLTRDPILEIEREDVEFEGKRYWKYKHEESDVSGVTGNSFLASASVVEHMRQKGVFRAMRYLFFWNELT